MTNELAKKILIAEDEKPLARALMLKLQNEGFDADMALDGEVVKEKLASGNYDLILMDLMMPHHDGFSLLHEMQEMGNVTPVVVLSNLGQEEDRKRAKEAGAREYFVKADTKLSDVVAYIKKTLGITA